MGVRTFKKPARGEGGSGHLKNNVFGRSTTRLEGGGDLSSFKTTVPKKMLGASENIYSGGSGNPIRSSPGRSNSILLIQSRSVQLNPIRSHPTQSNPVQSKPIQSNTTQSNPTQCNTRQPNPIQQMHLAQDLSLFQVLSKCLPPTVLSTLQPWTFKRGQRQRKCPGSPPAGGLKCNQISKPYYVMPTYS